VRSLAVNGHITQCTVACVDIVHCSNSVELCCYCPMCVCVCCKAGGHPQVDLSQFLQWMKLEPQSLVWIPVMHRLAAAEGSRHHARCAVCRSGPIVGIRCRPTHLTISLMIMSLSCVIDEVIGLFTAMIGSIVRQDKTRCTRRH